MTRINDVIIRFIWTKLRYLAFWFCVRKLPLLTPAFILLCVHTHWLWICRVLLPNLIIEDGFNWYTGFWPTLLLPYGWWPTFPLNPSLVVMNDVVDGDIS